MSRDLDATEKPTFVDLYGTGAACEACGAADPTIRVWEKYGTTSYDVGGDIGPDGIVAAVVVCEACGHGQTVSRDHILQAKQAS